MLIASNARLQRVSSLLGANYAGVIVVSSNKPNPPPAPALPAPAFGLFVTDNAWLDALVLNMSRLVTGYSNVPLTVTDNLALRNLSSFTSWLPSANEAVIARNPALQTADFDGASRLGILTCGASHPLSVHLIPCCAASRTTRP